MAMMAEDEAGQGAPAEEGAPGAEGAGAGAAAGGGAAEAPAGEGQAAGAGAAAGAAPGEAAGEPAPESSAQGAADAGVAPTEAERLAALEEELAQARQERDEYLALLQRLKADFDNFRRRAAADLARAREEGAAAFIRELLPVVDNLERALASGGEGPALRTGLEMTMKQLQGVLSRHGVEPIEAEGRPFDPQEHEALMEVPAQGRPPGHVAQVFERGYRMGPHLLRPARVAVTGSEEAERNG